MTGISPTTKSSVEAPLSRAWPIVGALPFFVRDGSCNYLTNEWKRCGDTFRVRIGSRTMLAIVHPDGIERVLGSNKGNYIKGVTYQHFRLLTGDGLLTLEGDAWRKRRRIAQPSFHRESIRSLTSSIVDSTRDMIDRLKRTLPRGGVFEAQREMMCLTLDVVGRALLGQPFGAERSEASMGAFSVALEAVSARGHSPLPLPLWVPTPDNVKFRRATSRLDEAVYEIIARERKNQHDKNTAAPTTLLSMLLAARDADTGEALGDVDLRNEVITIVLAGHETTALLLTWAFVVLADHPDVVGAMRDEVDRVLGGRDPAAEDLPKLVYLRQVVDELMRMRPPLWSLARDVVNDDELCGYRIAAGGIVQPLVFLTHRHPDFWPEPDRFDPSRFEPSRAKGRHNWCYLPFSLGPRMCIGNYFAIAEAQVILAMLLQAGEFDMSAARGVQPDAHITLRPGAKVAVHVTWH